MNVKIRPVHLSRPAVVYIRQSSLMQVLEHQQSIQRQYDLVDLAQSLGWEAAQIQVIDEDLGKSGKDTQNRSGFQRLAAEVSLGKVGAIVTLEVSRLARSCADWHRLLDLCALSDTLIIDDDGVYDTNDFNDRLVLGLKGTMSDAERHITSLACVKPSPCAIDAHFVVGNRPFLHQAKEGWTRREKWANPSLAK